VAYRVTRRGLEGVLALALALPGNLLNIAMVFFFRYGLDIHLFSHVLVVLGSANTVWAWQALKIPEVEFAELIKANELRPSAVITSQEVEDESSPVVHREGLAAILARRINMMSHLRLPLWPNIGLKTTLQTLSILNGHVVLTSELPIKHSQPYG